MQGLEDVSGGLGIFEFEAARRLSDKRGFMAQRLQEPQNAVAAFGRSQQYRANYTVFQFFSEIVKNLVARGRDIAEQLFHQLVVIIGELLQHLEAGFLFARRDLRRQFNDLAGRVFAVDISPLRGEIDEAGGNTVFPDRDLAQHQRLGAGGLQTWDDFAHLGREAVDLVQKQKVRQADIFEPF